jgi:hypothetical protein
VILKVDAKPLPPCEAIVVVAASSESAWRIAGSILGAMICDFDSSQRSLKEKVRKLMLSSRLSAAGGGMM